MIWVHITEQWPYRLSWMIYYAEQVPYIPILFYGKVYFLMMNFPQHESSLDDGTPLKDLYEKIKCYVPTQKDMEPLLEMDRDESKLAAMLNRKKQISLRDLKVSS